jgi:hypothetical protein
VSLEKSLSIPRTSFSLMTNQLRFVLRKLSSVDSTAHFPLLSETCVWLSLFTVTTKPMGPVYMVVLEVVQHFNP